MRFRSHYSFPVTIPTDLSRRIVEKRDFRVSKSGAIEIVVTGRVDVDAQIQSFSSEVGTYNIIRRAMSAGDLSLLKQGPAGVYADVSDAPKSIHEAMALSKKATDVLLKKRLEAAKKPEVKPEVKPEAKPVIKPVEEK